jgi:hypothetical protein
MVRKAVVCTQLGTGHRGLCGRRRRPLGPLLPPGGAPRVRSHVLVRTGDSGSSSLNYGINHSKARRCEPRWGRARTWDFGRCAVRQHVVLQTSLAPRQRPIMHRRVVCQSDVQQAGRPCGLRHVVCQLRRHHQTSCGRHRRAPRVMQPSSPDGPAPAGGVHMVSHMAASPPTPFMLSCRPEARGQKLTRWRLLRDTRQVRTQKTSVRLRQ